MVVAWRRARGQRGRVGNGDRHRGLPALPGLEGRALAAACFTLLARANPRQGADLCQPERLHRFVENDGEVFWCALMRGETNYIMIAYFGETGTFAQLSRRARVQMLLPTDASALPSLPELRRRRRVIACSPCAAMGPVASPALTGCPRYDALVSKCTRPITAASVASRTTPRRFTSRLRLIVRTW